MNAKVTIIVPIYNAAVFLPKTIKSIQAQTYTNLEIILVNDCSTDGSLSICKEFSANDSRIKIIDKQQNEGVDYARFSGLEATTGDFVTFLDADDSLCTDAVEIWLKIFDKYDVDIVYGNMVRVYSERFKIKKIRHLYVKYTERIIEGAEKSKLIISFFGVNIVPVNVCGNLYKSTLFHPPLEKSGLKFGEDLLLGLQLYHRANAVYVTSECVYLYRWGGVTATYQPHFLEAAKTLFRRKMAFIEGIDYPQARQTAIIELVNCLSTHVSDLATYFPRQKKNPDFLKAEMTDEIYVYFKEVEHNLYFEAGNLNDACRRLDWSEAYRIAAAQASSPKAKVKSVLRKIAARMLKYIKL